MNVKSRSTPKSRVKVGKFLRTRRLILDLTMAQIAFRAGTLSLSQMAIYKIENGIKGVRLSDVKPLSVAYGLEVNELLNLTGYSHEEFADYLRNAPQDPLVSERVNSDKLVTTEDLRFLVTISEGLSDPMNLGQVIQLLSRRQ